MNLVLFKKYLFCLKYELIASNVILITKPFEILLKSLMSKFCSINFECDSSLNVHKTSFSEENLIFFWVFISLTIPFLWYGFLISFKSPIISNLSFDKDLTSNCFLFIPSKPTTSISSTKSPSLKSCLNPSRTQTSAVFSSFIFTLFIIISFASSPSLSFTINSSPKSFMILPAAPYISHIIKNILFSRQNLSNLKAKS